MIVYSWPTLVRPWFAPGRAGRLLAGRPAADPGAGTSGAGWWQAASRRPGGAGRDRPSGPGRLLRAAQRGHPDWL